MKRQRGIALLMVLVAVALAVSLAAAITWNLTLDLHRSSSIIQGDQAYEYTLGAEAWAEQILYRDFTSNAKATTLGQNWAQQLPPLPVEGGQILGHIEDLQGRFNLNNLAADPNRTYFKQFQRLLTTLNLDTGIADAVVDWMDADDTPTQPGGAEVDYYSRLIPPYRPPNVPMASVSELQAVSGVTPQAYAALLPYVCVLPLTPPNGGAGAGTATSLNVNTASVPLLMSLATNLTQDQAQQIVDARGTNGFTDKAQFSSQIGSNALANAPAYDVNSQYFLLTVTAEIGTTHVTLYSLLYRAAGGGKTVALRRTLGTL